MKNSKKTLSVLLVLLIGAMLFGCSTTPTRGYSKTIEEAHPDRFEKTVIGMDVDEFKAIWPEASRSGIGDNSETYEFVYTHLLAGVTYDYKIYTYFHFANRKLIKYESQQRTF